MIYVYWYLGVCLTIAVVLYLGFIYSDIVHGPDHKFGYAYKSGMTFIMIGAVSIPILNLITIPWYAWCCLVCEWKLEKKRARTL